MPLKSLGVSLKLKLKQQLSITGSNIFHSQIFFQLKKITLLRKLVNNIWEDSLMQLMI